MAIFKGCLSVLIGMVCLFVAFTYLLFNTGNHPTQVVAKPPDTVWHHRNCVRDVMGDCNDIIVPDSDIIQDDPGPVRQTHQDPAIVPDSEVIEETEWDKYAKAKLERDAEEAKGITQHRADPTKTGLY